MAERKRDQKTKGADKSSADSAEDSAQKEDVENSAEDGVRPPFDLSKLGSDELKLAKKFGLDVEAMAAWFYSVETRLKGIEENLPEQVQEGLNRWIAQERARQAKMLETARANQPASGGGGGLQNVLLQALLGGGGGGDSEINKLLMELGKENLLIGREIQREFIKRSMPQVLDTVAEKMKQDREKKPE